MTRVLAVVITAGYLLVGGLPLSFAVTRRLVPALALAPLATALTASAATGLMLVTGGTLLAWFPVAFVAQIGLAYALIRRDRLPPVPATWWHVPVIGLVLLPPFLLIQAQPIAWDTHSIWWSHAGYFWHGADAARQAIANPAFSFSHVDYPPLASATVAVAWSLLGTANFRIAQIVVTALNFSAILTLVCAVRAVTARGRQAASWIVALGVGFAAWSLLPSNATDAHSDVLYSAAVAAAATLLLFGPDPLAPTRLALLLMAVGALTKNEGLILVLLVTVAVTLRQGHKLPRWRTPEGRRGIARLAVIWWPAAAGLAWMALVRSLGGQSDLAQQGRFGELAHGDLPIRDRLYQILTAYQQWIGITVLLAAVVAVAGAVFLRAPRRRLGIGSDLWIWGVAAAYLAVLTGTFLITPYDLTWHLETSANRVLLPAQLLICASAGVWAVVAASPSGPSPSGEVDDGPQQSSGQAPQRRSESPDGHG